MYKITAIAPTSYQFGSLLEFGMNYRNEFGRFVATQEFESEQEAKDYLKKRAEMYFESESELQKALAEIEKYGHLSIDAVTAYIEEINF